MSETDNVGLGKWAKIEETTANYFEFRHQQSIEVRIRDSSELVVNSKWASLISSLEVARYECLPHHFSLTFQPPLFRVKIKKKSHFQLVFEPVIS